MTTTETLPHYFHHAPEVWSADKCAKLAKRRPKDGLGTPGPQGYCPEVKSGPVRYNGGCERRGEWYPGEVFSLPEIPAGFKWDHVTSWGWFIRKTA